MDTASRNQQPNHQEPSNNKKESVPRESSTTTKANGGQDKNLKKEQGTKRIRVRNKKPKEVEDPKTIVKNILSKTDYKEANLSQFVDVKFYESPEYISEFKEQIKDINYVSTVGEVIDGFSDVNISVLPDKFKGLVNANPSSISCLPCLYQRPQTNRWKDKRIKAKEFKANKKAKKKQDELESKKKKVVAQDKNVESK